jgi:hypothetical protein
MSRWLLCRRDLLKRLGLGAAGLPLLAASRARAAAPRRRLIIVQTSQGYRQMYWLPRAGVLGELPDSCAPLEPSKRQLIFLPDLTNPGTSATGRNAFGVTFYGLGATGTGRYNEPAGKTLDQVVGEALRAPGQRVSLNLGVQLERPPRATNEPGGLYCFWAGPGMPIKPLGDPVAVYRELLAAGASDPATAKRLLARRRSILDYVGTSLDAYGKRLGTEDRLAVDGHMQSVRELEGQLQALAAGPACEPGPAPEAIDLERAANYARILAAHLRLMVIALRCDVTRVATLQTSDASGRNVDAGAFVPGIPSKSVGYKSATNSLRDLAHNPVVGGIDMKRIVDKWFMEQLGGLLAQLQAVPEDGATMLDSTVVLIGNHLQDGSNLNAQKLPWLLAGNSGGYLDTGRCLASAGRPTTSVMAAICEALGVASHPYGAAMPELKKV